MLQIRGHDQQIVSAITVAIYYQSDFKKSIYKFAICEVFTNWKQSGCSVPSKLFNKVTRAIMQSEYKTGKQCKCISTTLQKPAISASAEMAGFVLVGKFPKPSKSQILCELRPCRCFNFIPSVTLFIILIFLKRVDLGLKACYSIFKHRWR